MTVWSSSGSDRSEPFTRELGSQPKSHWGVMEKLLIGIVSVAVLAFGLVPAGPPPNMLPTKRRLQVLAPALQA